MKNVEAREGLAAIPLRYAVVLAATMGVAAGVGAYTFVYARGASYLTDDPAACANCHIMAEHYAAWLKSSHRAAAVCNDCHTPASLVGKYAIKVENGFRHSFAFTTGAFPDVFRARPRNRAVAEGACRNCHGDVVLAMLGGAHVAGVAGVAGVEGGAALAPAPSCVPCHATVGHWVR